MYKSIDQFQKDWKYESGSTIKLFEYLTDESLNQKITPDGRSLGFIAWHIVQTIPEMLGSTGLNIDGPAADSAVPVSAVEINKAFKTASDSLTDQLKKNWTDESLETEDNMYGETWKKGMTLSALILHQAHHRGQMTVLMRQAGLKVTGIYGPSKEEWEAMGMKALD